ncbi:hypothetical protein F5Y13DRAFT_189487 [Hypoxylon sp. FL1857]|nr:hypothetical protein F5Y13DRAFT_189487 [Hypoxylon sp. FL1857]
MASSGAFGAHIGGSTNPSSSNPFTRATAEQFSTYHPGHSDSTNPLQQGQNPFDNVSRNAFQNPFQKNCQTTFQSTNENPFRNLHRNVFENTFQNPFGNPFQKQDDTLNTSQDIVMTDAPLLHSSELDMEGSPSDVPEPTYVTYPIEMCWEPDNRLTYPIKMGIDSEYEECLDCQPTKSNDHIESASDYHSQANRIRGDRRHHKRQQRAHQFELQHSQCGDHCHSSKLPTWPLMLDDIQRISTRFQ